MTESYASLKATLSRRLLHMTQTTKDSHSLVDVRGIW